MATDAQIRRLAGHLRGNGWESRDAGDTLGDLHAPVTVTREGVFVTARTLFAAVGEQGTVDVLDRIEAAQGQGDLGRALSVAFGWVTSPSEGGIDVGSPNTRAVIDRMVGEGVLTAAEADTIKAMADRETTAADRDGVATLPDGRVAVGHVLRAQARIAQADARKGGGGG